jgi:hypothetical protein
LAHARGPLRHTLAELASRLASARGWERLGYARLRDYAVERLGLSARALQDLAHVGEALRELPTLAQALERGLLSWTKVRLLCRVARPEDEAGWVAYARRVTARELAREVRALDLGALEGPRNGRVDDDGAPEEAREAVVVPVEPFVRGRWSYAQRLAQRVAGESLPTWECMEAVAAEVVSALPLEPSMAREVAALPLTEPPAGAANGCAHQTARRPAPPPDVISRLTSRLDAADPFELDARLRRAVALEQRLEAELAPLLLETARRRLYRDVGCRSLEEFARERLGLSPRKARMLLRLARAGRAVPPLRAAWRDGGLSWVKAHALVPVLMLAPGRAEAWIGWAAGTTARRLAEDVDAALILADEDPHAFEATGGLPLLPRDLPRDEAPPGFPTGVQTRARPRESGASTEPRRLFWLAPLPAAVFFRAVLCSVRRHLERTTGRLPTPGQAFTAMLQHAIHSWTLREGRLPTAHRVFERDGWRCTVPGCTSYRNLHDHHVVFRSAGGGNELANRVTLCAWHHLRGVHAGRLRVQGSAPHGLTYELGIRAGAPALVAYSAHEAEKVTHPAGSA